MTVFKTADTVKILLDTIERYEKALGEIARGTGYYGAQAREYKEIARKALESES